MNAENQDDTPAPERRIWIDMSRYGSRALRYSAEPTRDIRRAYIVERRRQASRRFDRRHWLVLLGVMALVVAAACVADSLGGWLLYLAGRLPVPP